MPPNALTRRLVGLTAATLATQIVLMGVPAAEAGTFAKPSRASASQDVIEAEVLRLTNEARSQARECGGKRMPAVGPVEWNAKLARSANSHSADMARRNYFSHRSKSGKSPFARMRAAGYKYRAAGENIAAGRSLATAEAVVRAWLNSPGHCRVIMNGAYTDLGVGRVEGAGRYHVYWTQNFGRPR